MERNAGGIWRERQEEYGEKGRRNMERKAGGIWRERQDMEDRSEWTPSDRKTKAEVERSLIRKHIETT